MRSEDVINAVKDTLSPNLVKINEIIATISGGWEVWLQVESALTLLHRLGPGSTANREENYPPPDAALRADLVLHPARGTAVYLELKVQNHVPDNILFRFGQDIAKIVSLNQNTKRDSVVVALAFMQVFDSNELRAMRGIHGGTLQVLQWVRNQWWIHTDNPLSGYPTLASFKLP